MCGAVRAQVSPASGVTLPRDPYLLIVQKNMPFDADTLFVRVDGVPARFTSIRTGNAQWVHVDTGNGRELTVHTPGDDEFRYPIDSSWHRSQSRVAGVARVTDRWSCSFTDVIRLEVDSNAIGFLAEWAGREPGSIVIQAGRAPRIWWLPAVGTMFVDGEAGLELATPPRFTQVDLGHENCLSWNIPEALYQSHGTVTLTALHADGTSEPLGDLRLAADLELPEAGVIDLTPSSPAPIRDGNAVLHETAAADAHLRLTAALGNFVTILISFVSLRRQPRTAVAVGTILLVAGCALALRTHLPTSTLIAAAACGSLAAALLLLLTRHPHGR
jgi:hypothetical protein